MDLWVRGTVNKIGPGGLKCKCCNDYRSFGNRRKNAKRHRRMLTKMRRTALKKDTAREIRDSE